MTASRKPRILIVDDEALVLEIACMEFEDAGFDVLAASDGTTALELIGGDPDIDLLFTDIRMPGTIDGWALAQSGRQLRAQLPVIYATGFSADTPRMVDDALFFTKPYRLGQIVEAAQRLLGG
ncbi:MAG: hypothetical protein RL490_367 [Pseudomonadota bacterium]|jgi:CheY-like chemotaxis protein